VDTGRYRRVLDSSRSARAGKPLRTAYLVAVHNSFYNYAIVEIALNGQAGSRW
jgi:hypothetical protein